MIKQPSADPGRGAANRQAAGRELGLALEERQRRIRAMIEAQAQGTVTELARHFGVSAVTIRTDLAALENMGAVVRYHGGALPRGDSNEVPIDIKQTLHHAEKVRIATAAVELIRDGETLILDSGTTTAEIAKQIRALKLSSINVITNALNIAVLLANTPHVNLIIPGGILRRKSWSLSGPQAEQSLRDLQADHLFLGVDSLDPEIGLMTPDPLEAQLCGGMIEASREVVVVADSTKFERRSLSVIAKLDAVDKVITDSGVSPSWVAALRAQNVDVEVV